LAATISCIGVNNTATPKLYYINHIHNYGKKINQLCQFQNQSTLSQALKLKNRLFSKGDQLIILPL